MQIIGHMHTKCIYDLNDTLSIFQQVIQASFKNKIHGFYSLHVSKKYDSDVEWCEYFILPCIDNISSMHNLYLYIIHTCI